MRIDKERKCLPSVKVLLAPLPTRNLSFSNSLNLEECLNRSVAMDRPSSRISELSNYSSNSVISVSRNNYDQKNEDLRRSMNRSVIEALRMKDLRRKRNRLSENADSYSVDLSLDLKRKRAYDNDDLEPNFLFNRSATNENQGTKFARGMTSMNIPTKNRFVSSQFKNNEIVSSYYSINQPMNNVASNYMPNQIVNKQNTNQLINQQRNYSINNSQHFSPMSSQMLADQFTLSKRSPTFQTGNSSEPKKITFQVPLITISNSDSKENSGVSNTLSNTSLSPITRKTIDTDKLLPNLSKSSNSSSSIEEIKFENMGASFEDVEKDQNTNYTQSPKNDRIIDKTIIISKSKEKNHSPTYKIPEHFHSIDEHIRDEKKARSRLGNFLKAIYNATSPFASNEEQKNVITTTVESNLILPTNITALVTFPTTTLTTTKASDSQFKLPSLSLSTNDSKLNTTSAPLKINFNLSGSNDKSSGNNSNFVFKFGSEQSTKKDDHQTIETTKTNTTSSSIFNLSSSSVDKPKDTITDKFTLPQISNSLSTTLPNTNFKSTIVPTFTLGLSTTQQSNTPKQDSNNQTFATNQSSLLNFNQNTDNPTASVKEANKTTSSSFVFKFGETNTSLKNQNANSNELTATSVFNFDSKPATNNGFNQTTNLNAPNSIFSFGQTEDKQTLSSASNSSTFTFGNSKKNNTPFDTTDSTILKNPSNITFNNFSAPSNQNATSQNSITSIKPNFSFSTSNTNDFKSNDLLSSTKNNNLTNKTNVGFPFNLNANVNTNFGSNLTQSSSTSNVNSSNKALTFNFSVQQANTSTPFKFNVNQTQPSFNFGSSTNQPSSFNFSATPVVNQFNTNNNTESTFAAPTFNPASKNIFTIGRK